MDHADDNRRNDSPSRKTIGKTVQVLLPVPLDRLFDYLIPEQMPELIPDEDPQGTQTAQRITLGSYVYVPFGRSQHLGVVWSEDNPDPTLSPDKLKPIREVIDVPPMDDTLRKFIDWVAAYTMQPRSVILKQALSVDSAKPEPLTIHYIKPAHPPTSEPSSISPTKKPSAARQRVLAVIDDGLPRLMSEIAREASCSPSVVKKMIEEGYLAPHEIGDRPPPKPDPNITGPTLSPAQRDAADTLCQHVRDHRFSVTVLEGVTGSGKTEVFATAIREALKAGRQVLILMPEIALTVQMLRRFTKLFGAEPVQWHSELAQGTRRRNWRAITNGTAQLIIGARSALFLPFADLGLVVIDEEHDGAYKQEEGVNYHARDMAIVRARLHDIPIILASATPSIETMVNVEEGKYEHVFLPERHGSAVLPTVSIIDLLKDKNKLPRNRWLSPTAVTAIEQTLARGEQVLLFLNRRGYAPLTLCRSCGHRIACPNCTAWMVLHRTGPSSGTLQCHHCGHKHPMPQTCPHCGVEDNFAPCGPGVERLDEEAAELFPDARRLIVASDMLSGWKQVQAALDDVVARKYDIIIGTQIVAKGHNFPHLTLVVIVDGDMGLDGGDVRAAERCFQVLHQVGGRAGRAELPGSVLVQTHCADNFLFQALRKNDREGFIEHEISIREEHNWPPFTRLAALLLTGNDAGLVEATAKNIRKKWPENAGIEVFGPAPAPLARLRGSYRVRLLVRAEKHIKLQHIMASWLSQVSLPRTVELKIIIDPFTFL